MSDPFARMTKSIFDHFGEDAFLRSSENCRVEVQKGVEVATAGEYGDIVAHRTVLNIAYEGIPTPKKGDKVTVGAKTYTLDALLRDDAYSARWIVL